MWQDANNLHADTPVRPVVDTDALVMALDEGRLAGAGLDVIEGEPQIQADHPILKQPRCVVSCVHQ